MARRVLFTSQKGGVGKSTLARSAAVALASTGRTVLIADYDTDQRTCMRWHAQRLARDLVPRIDAAPFTKQKKLGKAEAGYADVVIDTRGQFDELALGLARSAHAIILPSSYSMDDIGPTLRVVERLRAAGIPDRRIAVLFCRTGGSARQARQCRSVLEMNAIRALGAALPQKDGFVTLYATGRSGREAPNMHLRNAALAVDKELLAFVDEASGMESRPRGKAGKGGDSGKAGGGPLFDVVERE